MQDLVDYGELSQVSPFDVVWAGSSYLPWSNIINGRDIFGNIAPYRHLTPFDRDSIMLYASEWRDPRRPVMVFKSLTDPRRTQVIRKS